MILPPLTYWLTPHFHIDDLGSNGDHNFQIDNLLTFIWLSLSLLYWLAPKFPQWWSIHSHMNSLSCFKILVMIAMMSTMMSKFMIVNSGKDIALALSSDMDDLWIAVLLQSLFLLQYCPLLRVLSIALWQSGLGGGGGGDTLLEDENLPCPFRQGCRCWCSARSESEALDSRES